LEEILQEFSRFNKREVIIVDQDLKRMRMSVAIKPDNLEDFIDLLELSAGVKATDTPSGSILLSRSSN
jgi:transmembrane sensor